MGGTFIGEIDNQYLSVVVQRTPEELDTEHDGLNYFSCTELERFMAIAQSEKRAAIMDYIAQTAFNRSLDMTDDVLRYGRLYNNAEAALQELGHFE